MIDYDEIAVLDRNAFHLGVPTFVLMENAGDGVAKTVKDNTNIRGKSAVVFCGLGNNGGDGFVAARRLVETAKCKVRVILLGMPGGIRTTIASEQFYRLPKEVEIITLDKGDTKNIKKLNIMNDTAIIDAMLGVGISGTLREPYSSIVKLINSVKQSKNSKIKGKKSTAKSKKKAKPLVVAVDVPTGLGTKSSVTPDITVTFHDSKTGMSSDNSGKIIIHDIGIPLEAEKYVGPGELTFLPELEQNSHKGDHGRLLIIGGGPYTGAPALVGLGALRTGVDLVHFAIPNKIYNLIAGFSPNFIVHPLEENQEYLVEKDVMRIIGLIKEISADALVIGPGLGRNTATCNAIIKIIEKVPKNKPMLIDADALTALAILSSKKKIDPIKLLKKHSGILTPHAGEFTKLTSSIHGLKELKIIEKGRKKGSGKIDNIEIEHYQKIVKQFAKALGPKWTVLLKGNIDIITDGKNVKLNRTGNPGMTVGGSGDVLAGIGGALLAQGMDSFKAARCAAFINGYSGDLAWDKYRNGLMATDIIDMIPQCLEECLD